MAYTGYLVNVYMDANPYSETYGQERTERVLDTENCPVQQPANYVEVYTYCEMTPNGAYTGNCIKVYEDVEPMSATYGQQREEVYTDGVLCPPDSEESDWQQIDQYCEQIAYQPSGKLGNSGYQIIVFQDMGSFSPTYQQTRETRTEDLVNCPLPDTSDVWVIISETCHLVNGLKDGTKDVVRVNTNEYSPNYNDGVSETINVEDLIMCPLDPESPIWTETSYVCVLDEGYRTGYVTVTEEDTNPQSATYGQTRTRTYEDTERCPVQPKPQPVALKWRVINNRGASTDTITNMTLHFNSNFDIDILGSISPAGGMLQGTSLLPASLTSTGLVCASIELSPNTSSPTIFQFSQTPNPFVWDNTSGSAVLTVTLWDGDGTGPEWTEVSYSCETVDGYRTGASIVVEEDMNPNSSTYGEQRTRIIENDPRCPAQTDANWVETSWTCETVNGFNTGNKLSVQTDQNPNSSTYGSTRTRIIYDIESCPIDTTPHWVEESYACEQGQEPEPPEPETYDFSLSFHEQGSSEAPALFYYGSSTLDYMGVVDFFESYVNDHPGDLDIIVGDYVTVLDDAVFYGQSTMKTIIISANVNTIGTGQYQVFEGCTNLTSITCLNPVPPTLQSGAFDNLNANLVIYVPSTSLNTYKNATNWSAYSTKIYAIPNS